MGINSNGAKIDMLQGPLLSRILLFAFPLIASGVLQQSFNSVDVAVVGRFTGSHALAAVGSTGPVIGLLVNLFVGLSVGVNVIIANYIGQRNPEGIRRAIGATAVLSVIGGLAMLIIGEFAARPVLELLGTPDSIIDDATLYVRVFVAGLPFMLIYNFGAAVLRSVGDTRRPFYALVIAGIVNVALNLIFVIGLGMGVEGVAWGTVASNVVNAAIIVGLLMREKGEIRLVFKDVRPNWPQLRKICAIGVPAGMQGAVFAFSNAVILSAINSFGPDATAGSAAAINYEFYCYFIVSAFAQTAVAFISQNYGAGNYERIKRVFRLCLLLAVAGTAVFNITFALGRDFFILAFTTDPAVISFADTRMLVVLLFQFIAGYYEVAGSSMRGLGYSMTPTLIIIFGTCVLRLLWVFMLPVLGHDFAVLMAVYPVSWMFTNVAMFFAFRYVMSRTVNAAH